MGHSYKGTALSSTGVNALLQLPAPASTGQRYLVGGLVANGVGNPIVWELLDGANIIQHGGGLAGADAGFSDGDSEVEISPGASCALRGSVVGGSTTALRLSLKFRVDGANN